MSVLIKDTDSGVEVLSQYGLLGYDWHWITRRRPQSARISTIIANSAVLIRTDLLGTLIRPEW